MPPTCMSLFEVECTLCVDRRCFDLFFSDTHAAPGASMTTSLNLLITSQFSRLLDSQWMGASQSKNCHHTPLHVLFSDVQFKGVRPGLISSDHIRLLFQELLDKHSSRFCWQKFTLFSEVLDARGIDFVDSLESFMQFIEDQTPGLCGQGSFAFFLTNLWISWMFSRVWTARILSVCSGLVFHLVAAAEESLA